MKALRLLAQMAFFGMFFMPFMAIAGIEPAQSAPKIIVSQVQLQAQSNPAVLPLRNLQIEIRQIGNEATQRSSVDAQGRVILQPGNSRGAVSAGIDQSRSTQGRSLQQQALVLNGRSVSFSLGQTVPLRVVQVLIYKDTVNLVPSSVLIDRNSGFSARPLWYGDDVAEVEISTALAQGVRESKVSTTLPVQLGEWITIAQTEDAQNSSTSSILSRSSESSQSSLRVEMRLTVK
ncbi:hypothetical protein [Variovorax sp. PCZ-1]|uniref:hypothetical protein n=1 Tax=Variovorax sp. PCZ-1 TaxID=2835533 RepID=UPI001BCA751E|nr:hypothetical protein [Variovorax sp. PCZ-1]MBS7807019.1 hypothetical protein [Variovorax sp. PCZ-1]